jgi:hypothetical protein
MDSLKDQWYKQQVDHISEALQELLNDDDFSIATRGISEAIAEWEDYHGKELAKWQRLRALLNLEAGT